MDLFPREQHRVDAGSLDGDDHTLDAYGVNLPRFLQTLGTN
jgi:hypothetical protein